MIIPFEIGDAAGFSFAASPIEFQGVLAEKSALCDFKC